MKWWVKGLFELIGKSVTAGGAGVMVNLILHKPVPWYLAALAGVTWYWLSPTHVVNK